MQFAYIPSYIDKASTQLIYTSKKELEIYNKYDQKFTKWLKEYNILT